MVEQILTPATKTNGTVSRWDPFAMLETLQHEMENLWHRPFFYGAGPWPTFFLPLKGSGMTFAPRTDVYEKGDVLVFKAEMPGLKKEDVSVELYDGDLVIKGEAKAEKAATETAYYRMERTYGSFYRRIPIPFEVKPEQITAALTDGVLEIQIPKPVAPKPESTRIPVA
jgi:HSP20 family protein